MPGRSLLARSRCESNRQQGQSSFFPTSDLIRSLSEPTPSLHSTGAPLVLHHPVHQWVDEPEEDESWLPGAWGSDVDEDELLDADSNNSDDDDFFGMEHEAPTLAVGPSPSLAPETDYPPSHSPQPSSDLELTPCHSLLTTPTFSDASTPTMPPPIPIPIPGSPSSSCSESHTPRSHPALPNIIPGGSSPSHMHNDPSLFLAEEEEAALFSPGSYASYASSSASYALSLAPSSLCSWSASPSTHSAFRRSPRISSADTISDFTPSAEWSDSDSDVSDEDDEDSIAQMTSGLVRFSLDTFSSGKRQGSGGMPPMVVDSVSPCSRSPYLTTPPEIWDASVGGQESLGNEEQSGKQLGMSIPMSPSPLGRQPSLSI